MRLLPLALASTAVLALAACERPTGPELVARIDQAERDMLSDTTAERTMTWNFAGSWELIRLLPNGRVEPNLLANIDGKEHRFKAFVFERVVIRFDQSDGYSCPLQLRELLAIEGGSQGFMLKGSDFSQPIGESSYCQQSVANFGGASGAAPTFWVARPGNAPGMVGVSGNARIDDAARTGDCSFLKVDRSFPLKVDCELRDYEVQLAVGTRTGKDGPLNGLLAAKPFFTVSTQRVPGLRLVIHCDKKQDTVGGCEPMPGRSPE
jgi:hypothetical protein